jgi:hypothetical protein
MHWRVVTALGIFLLALLNIWAVLDESYGSGPPYFSRTVNMDKWTNPIPMLTTYGLIPVGLILAVLLPLFRRR